MRPGKAQGSERGDVAVRAPVIYGMTLDGRMWIVMARDSPGKCSDSGRPFAAARRVKRAKLFATYEIAYTTANGGHPSAGPTSVPSGETPTGNCVLAVTNPPPRLYIAPDNDMIK
jgi:hypothetical protein